LRKTNGKHHAVEADIADIYRIIEIEAAIAQLKVDPVGMRTALVVISHSERGRAAHLLISGRTGHPDNCSFCAVLRS
jgi:hypothetical protein